MDEQTVPDGPRENAVPHTPVPQTPVPAAEHQAAEHHGGTGEPRVDAALRLLERLDGLPVSAHPELFERVHEQLSEVLSELDSGPAGPSGGPES